MALLITVLKLVVGLLVFPVYVLHFLGLWDPICKRFFSFFMSIITRFVNHHMQLYKKELFSTLGDFAGPSGQLTLLEIGCGSGANFQFYPQGCRVTCLDPNPHFQRYLDKSLKKNGHVRFERFLVIPGEEMTQVATASVDVVVCTLVLCSVKDIDAMLREIKRVLRPFNAPVVIIYSRIYVKEKWSSKGMRYKDSNNGRFPPFTVFTDFIRKLAVRINIPVSGTKSLSQGRQATHELRSQQRGMETLPGICNCVEDRCVDYDSLLG
uniref:Methyltransferase-like protein 7A n=1 Tax=Geotrypetes seraphini TaxID=260995 RepID=A0A6P8Q907_GEOSA|nr:methyltransferase-like protein 7A [Geotrypetes seraphini]